MHADRYAPSAGGVVIPRERPLVALIEPPLCGQRQRMSRNHQACAQLRADPGRRQWIVSHQYLPSRVSKCVGLPRLRPPCLTQAAVQQSIVSSSVAGVPNSEQSFDALPVRHVSLSRPAKLTGLSNNSPRREVTVLTRKVSGLVRLNALAGELAKESERSTNSLASACQMQLNQPLATSTGRPVQILSARSRT